MRSLLPALAVLALGGTAHAYSVRVHVYGANLIAEDAADGEIDLGAWGKYKLDPDVQEAITRYPSSFRAGSVGPDGYPDIFTGQAFTHGDQSTGLVQYLLDKRELTCPVAEARGWCTPGSCAANRCTAPQDDLVPYRYMTYTNQQRVRPQRFWRSIDWAHALVDDARNEIAEVPTGDIEQRNRSLQALSFAYGYLMHYAGDGFAHQWVNLYAEGAWDYFDESLNPEFRHVALERYLEHLMGPAAKNQALWNTRSVDIPVWFLRKYLVEKYIGGCTIDPKNLQLGCTNDSAARGAAHLRFMLGYRQALEQLRDNLPAPPAVDLGLPIIVSDPSSYSSIWSYIVNRCVDEVVVGGFLAQGNCLERLYRMAFHTYVADRLKATNLAIDQWLVTSNAIVQDMLTNGVSASSIRAKLDDFATNYMRPMFIPGPNDPLRQFFGISCRDVGPPNFEKVCEAMMTEVRKVFGELQDQVEAAFTQRMQSWFDAYDRYLCAFEELLRFYTQPKIMINWVFCGTPNDCARSVARREQIEQDVLATGIGDDFLPFQDTLALSRLILVEDQKRDMTQLVTLANAFPGSSVLIDPLTAKLVNDPAYERVIFESIASLDGKQAIEENVPGKGGVANPDRVLYDQFRKAPRSALLLDAALHERLYKPLFRIHEQDPDGDQIILAYDLCPCIPEVLGDNMRDRDGDRVGDACDPETRGDDLTQLIDGMPSSEFDSQRTREHVRELVRAIMETCYRRSNADARVEAGNWLFELERLHNGRQLGDVAFDQLYQQAKQLITIFKNGGMSCADRPLPQVVKSCP